MNDLVFSDVTKVFTGGVTAVERFSLTIPDPCMAVLVGPSGCGKTTLLRMVAGLDHPTTGTMQLGGTRLDTQAPRDRDVAMVFQSYALYPHMSVRGNLSFGLRLRKLPRAEIDRRVEKTAATLELSSLLDRRPAALSGGQRQRVALGRAIIREPRVFLFDEPLSNLDARLRTEMRAMIKKLYSRLRTTSIYVTHDQVEAMTIGELLVVMKDGRIHQVGTPEACYREPADTFVASFLGSPAMNLIGGVTSERNTRVDLDGGVPLVLAPEHARSLGSESDTRVTVGVRPEDIHATPPTGNGTIHIKGRVVLTEPLGHEVLTHVRVGESEWVARGPREFERDESGETSLYLDVAHIHVFRGDEGRRIGTAGAAVAAAAAKKETR